MPNKGYKQTEEHKRNAKAKRGKTLSEETKRRMSEAKRGNACSEETRRKISETKRGKTRPPMFEEQKRKLSATMQGIPYDEWEAYASEQKYCPLFNEACREANRAKYNYECFVCGKPQSENKDKNGKVRKLGVHHIDMDKNQGCDGHKWKLIPTCMKCHPGTHHEEIIARLLYLIKEI